MESKCQAQGQNGENSLLGIAVIEISLEGTILN